MHVYVHVHVNNACPNMQSDGEWLGGKRLRPSAAIETDMKHDKSCDSLLLNKGSPDSAYSNHLRSLKVDSLTPRDSLPPPSPHSLRYISYFRPPRSVLHIPHNCQRMHNYSIIEQYLLKNEIICGQSFSL